MSSKWKAIYISAHNNIIILYQLCLCVSECMCGYTRGVIVYKQ